MPFQSKGLSPAEINVVDRLVDACRLLDDSIYWRQSDLAGLALYKTTKDPTIKELAHHHGQPLGSARRERAVRRHRADAAGARTLSRRA